MGGQSGQFLELVCQNPEEFKAWSQNLGHDKVHTTFCSYGSVGTQGQGDILRSRTEPRGSEHPDAVEFAKAVARELRDSGSIK